MISIKSMRQIPTSHTIPGFRAMKTVGRSHHLSIEYARQSAGKYQQLAHIARLQWLNQQWH